MAAVVSCGMRSRLGGRAGVLVDALSGARRFFIPLLLELRSILMTTKLCSRAYIKMCVYYLYTHILVIWAKRTQNMWSTGLFPKSSLGTDP